MKILHYLPGLPLVMQGGMIKYALDLVRGESQADHEVIMLVPGHFTHFHKDNTRIIKANWNGKECYRIINSLPVSGGKGVTGNSEFTRRGNRDVYVSFLEKMQPDIIHIHSFMGMHVAFLEAAAQLGIPIVYTTHDYYGICPKAILLNNMEQCEEVDGSRCAFCIDKTISIKRLKW
ncbi:MAG: glycosyltransferase, partial [Lachnospiraceae bacterium]|nr:glycosyltransferase [Lachnospiraceae bacterium]